MVKNDPDDQKLIEKMAGSRVLVIGDIMLDRYVYGRVDRISPESPVPILSITRETRMLGGAGNTLSNLAHLKCDANIICVVGQDDDGLMLGHLTPAFHPRAQITKSIPAQQGSGLHLGPKFRQQALADGLAQDVFGCQCHRDHHQSPS